MSLLTNPFWPTLGGTLEDEYRRTTEARERQVVVIGAVTIIVATVAFTLADWVLVGSQQFDWPLSAARIGLAALALVVLIVFRSGTPHRKRDLWISLLLFGLVSVDVVSALRHDDPFIANFVLSPMLVLAIYVMLGTNARASMIAALVDTAGSLVVAFEFRTLAGVELLTIVLTFGIANLLGIITVRWLRKSGRDAFLALRAETASKEKLQRALHEIATLRGIVPICAACKKIRDDSGHWHQLEAYVQKRSEATFSHGLCPSCVPDYFAGVLPE